jgi:hypothetical protein
MSPHAGGGGGLLGLKCMVDVSRNLYENRNQTVSSPQSRTKEAFHFKLLHSTKFVEHNIYLVSPPSLLYVRRCTQREVKNARVPERIDVGLAWGRILGRNPDTSLTIFSPCYSKFHLYSVALRFIFLQPLTVPLQYAIKENGGKPDRKPYHLPYGLRNPCRNLKSDNMPRNLNEIVRSWIRLLAGGWLKSCRGGSWY